MIEKTAVFARYLLQPTESLDNGLAVEALIFPAYPIGKHHVQVVHNFDKLGLAKLVVVIVPTSHLALNLYCYLLEFPVKMGMQLPLFHLLMQLLHRFLADLIRETFEYKFAFQHTGILDAPLKEQLSEFRQSLYRVGMGRKALPKTWNEAFHLLEDWLESLPEGKKVVFIDELPWMDTTRSNFIRALDHFWNSWATARKDIILVVCGSATSWIIDNIVMNYLNMVLAYWVRRKYKRFHRKPIVKAFGWLQDIASKDRSLFYHWQRGQTPRLCLCTKR